MSSRNRDPASFDGAKSGEVSREERERRRKIQMDVRYPHSMMVMLEPMYKHHYVWRTYI